MKKFLAVLLLLIACFTFCACSDTANVETETAKDKVRAYIENYITVDIMLSYETVGVPQITFYFDEYEENCFDISGKVTVKDKYGDSYTGKYDATVIYDKETDKCKRVSYNLETPSKN